MTSQDSVVVDYDPQWPQQFQEIRALLYPQLKDLIMGIEHVGSTAVPGLAAKPVIDVDIIYDHPDLLPEIVARLQALGYEYVGDRGIAGRESFVAPAGAIRQNLYACRAGWLPLRSHLRLRDHLRQNPADRDRYGALKKSIAPLYEVSVDDYVEAKTEFILEILSHYDLTPNERATIEAVNKAPKK